MLLDFLVHEHFAKISYPKILYICFIGMGQNSKRIQAYHDGIA
jgi:hypothetical protein